jgi:hypothetical protein
MHIKAIFYSMLAAITLFLISSTVSARGTSERMCNKVLESLDISSYPRKRQTFTILKPECISDNRIDFFIRQKFTINPGQNINADSLSSIVEAVAPTMKKSLCQGGEDLFSLMKYRLDFFLPGSNDISRSISIDEATCKENNKLAVGSNTAEMNACNAYAETLRKDLPAKIGSEITRVNIRCKAGFTKPVALVIEDELNIKRSKEDAKAIFAQAKVRDGIVEAQCSDKSFVSSLNFYDIVFVYILESEEVGEIRISRQSCAKQK